MSALRDVLARLPAIKATAEKATPGPWTYDALLDMANVSAQEAVMEDIEFIASARTDVPALVAALEEARELLRRVQAEQLLPPLVDLKPDCCEQCALALSIREALGR